MNNENRNQKPTTMYIYKRDGRTFASVSEPPKIKFTCEAHLMEFMTRINAKDFKSLSKSKSYEIIEVNIAWETEKDIALNSLKSNLSAFIVCKNSLIETIKKEQHKETINGLNASLWLVENKIKATNKLIKDFEYNQ